MGLKELVAVAALALTSCQIEPSKQSSGATEKSVNDKPADINEVLKEALFLHRDAGVLSKAGLEEAQQSWSKAEQLLLKLEKGQPNSQVDFLLAELYTQRNKPGKHNEPGDREKAIPLWERFSKAEPKFRINEQLTTCYATAGMGKFYEAQILTQFEKSEETGRIIKEIYKIGTNEQARTLGTEKLRSCVELLEKTIQYTTDTGGIGIMTFQFKDTAQALEWYRRMVTAAPEISFGYRRLALHYESQGKLGHVLDELNEMKEIPEDVKRPKLIDTMIDLLDSRRKMGLRPTSTPDNLDNLKVALLLYETSATRWEREMKKESMHDRNFSAAIEEAFIAGTLDYNGAQTDEHRASALKRLEGTYNLINGGMDNGLGRLDKMYEHIIAKNKLKVEGTDKVSEALKARFAGKKDF